MSAGSNGNFYGPVANNNPNSLGPYSFPTNPSTLRARAGYSLNAQTKLAQQPVRVDAYNQAIYAYAGRSKNKRVLIVLLALAIVLYHGHLTKGK
jgi:hypothetical protein